MSFARKWIKDMLVNFFPIIEYCHKCGIRQPLVWTATDELWKEITDEENGAGVYCPECFDDLADKKRISLRWVPQLDYRF